MTTSFFLATVSLQGCDNANASIQSVDNADKEIATKSVLDDNKKNLATECPTDMCLQKFAVLPADTKITNPKDPTSVFLSDVRKKYPDAVALYAGVYESKSSGLMLNIPYIEKPVILYLGSYHSINWTINTIADADAPKKKTKIVAVVYGSYDKGTQIKGVDQTLVFDSHGRVDDYDVEVSCDCAGGNFHCSGADVYREIGKLQHQYGFQVLDFSTAYSANELNFKNIHAPLNFAKIATKNQKKYDKQKRQCNARALPDYENTYEGLKKNNQSEMTYHSENASYVIRTRPNMQGGDENNGQDFDNYLYKFPLTTNTWGDYLNPEHGVPDVGYTAYYINADDIGKVVKQRQEFTIEKKYAYDEFLGIPSEKLNAYWVGILSVPKAEFYDVQMNKSWSGGRVLIDKRVIIEGGKHDRQQKVFLPKGNHLIEVEYSNSWHTTDVEVLLRPLSKIKKPEDPTEFLSKIKKQYPNVVALSAGAYEAKKKAIVLDIPKMTAPVVLYLGTYESVKWQINNPNNTDIVGVVYGSYERGTEVQGIAQDKIINVSEQFTSYDDNVINHCLANKKQSKYAKYGINVIEYVGKYSTDYFRFKPYSGCQQ